jgi:hypothetical protein
MKMKYHAALLAAVACVGCGSNSNAQTTPEITAQITAQATFRPPSVPLVTHDPYLSLWSNSDRLTDSSTAHWTGRGQGLTSLIRVDGKPFRLMGDTPLNFAVLPQTNLQVLPTRTIFTFAGEGVQVRLTFTSPLLPNDMELLSRPLSYISWDVVSTDGATHDASIYFDASSRLAVNNDDQEVVWQREKAGNLTALRLGSESQPVLQKTGDDLRIDWGYAYIAAPSASASFSLGDNAALETTFGAMGTLPAQDDSQKPRATRDKEPAAALSFKLGRVGAQPISRMAMLAYDDHFSIQYMGRNLRPFWRRGGADAAALLQSGQRDYAAVLKRCAAFDTELMGDLTRLGGDKFAQLGALSHRQALAAQKIVADANGQPLSFSKENNSNGCIATVDVIYPAAPQMIAMSPELLKASLQPIMAYGSSAYWKWPFAPHDLGTYPKANGQVYGGGERTEENQMPVEESGNLLILLGALSKVEGNTKFADQFWPTMTKWANYLADKGFDPESQLSTDDFAGHLAHNVNLSAKAVVALGAYAQMAQMRGETANAQKYRTLAEQFAAQWVKEATDGDHTKLAFDKPGTWSQKYNLAWDSILDLKLFPQSLYDSEMAYYKTKMNVYGLPLDSRRDYTKLDWEIWTGTLTGNRADLEAIVSPIYDWMNATSSRVPLTDWYDTKDGKQQNFKARSVVGGVFIPMLKDAAIWKKWAARDNKKLAGWAPMPSRPTYRPIVAAGDKEAKIQWKYTLDAPVANWFATGFDDSSWKSGVAGFGTQGTPAVEIRTPWTSKDIWMRRRFTFKGKVPAATQIFGFHDDEADFYLNGKRIGPISGYNASYEAITDIPAGVLKEGENVLAVHVHQDGGGQGVDIGISEQVN